MNIKYRLYVDKLWSACCWQRTGYLEVGIASYTKSILAVDLMNELNFQKYGYS